MSTNPARKFKFTAEAIKALPIPLPALDREGRSRTAQVIYYDTEQPGLGLRVTSGGSRVFVAELWHGGRSVRVKLARCSDLTLTQARQRARIELGRIGAGVNTNQERRIAQARALTLEEALEAYLKARKPAKRTEYDYRRLVLGAFDEDRNRTYNGYLSPWAHVPLSSITHEMVAKRYGELVLRSPAQANYAMRLLRGVFGFARANYRAKGDPAMLAENPVHILTELKAWRKIERRSTVIRPHQLKAWFEAVLGLKSPANNDLADVVRDYLLFLVLTGLRRGEAARLKWADVDLKGRLFTVRGTKNGRDHTLPLSDYLQAMLSARPRDGVYVFPGAGKHGYLVEPKKMVERVREKSEISFTLHDLRRTFATIADQLDMSRYAVKRLLNHAMGNDVTAGYIVADVERLREPMQRITDFMLRAAGIKETAPVVQLERATGT